MKPHRLFSRLRVLCVLVLAALLVTCWMLTRHIPAWYAPAGLLPAQLDAAQTELEHLVEVVTEKMVQGDAFTVTLTARQINKLLALQRARWPALTGSMEQRLRGPYVCLGAENVTLAARCRWGAFDSVLSMDLRPAVHSRIVQVHVEASRAGSLRLPTALLTRQFNSHMQSLGRAPDTGEDPGARNGFVRIRAHGNRFEIGNEFEWPNGQIPFRVTAVRMSDQRITLRIQPQ